MDDFLKKQILSFDLHKNQTYVDRLMKEGELQGYNRLLKLYENMMENYDSDDLKGYHSMLKITIGRTIDELQILKATENVFAILDKDVQDSLTSLDILDKVKLQKDIFSPDVKARVNSGKCALKRPGGKKKFNCDNEVINGTKYCKEHLKKYSPLKYCEVIPENEE